MKIPFVNYNVYHDLIHKTEEKIKTTSRSTTIIDAFIGKSISIYTGKTYKTILLEPEMIGMKFGCFSFTKKLGSSIHNSEHNRKKIAKMKRKITAKKIRKPTIKKVKQKTVKKK